MTGVVGRFAPSPTGALHLGSLIAATASYLNAKQQGGRWLLRMDDIDTPRVVTGSDALILKTLADFGFEWDGVIYQSQRHEVYRHALAQLQARDHLYACLCTRKQLKDRGSHFPFYDRHCRDRNIKTADIHTALRLKTPLEGAWQWRDLIQGEQQTRWQIDTDDFIIQRSDGIFAYHLACALDDVDFGITEVIRGADLLASTAPQQLIQSLLGKSSPNYAHHPLITDAQTGIKFSKASHAPALDTKNAARLVLQALSFLGQCPPTRLEKEPLMPIWQWAITNWQLKAVPKQTPAPRALLF